MEQINMCVTCSDVAAAANLHDFLKACDVSVQVLSADEESIDISSSKELIEVLKHYSQNNSSELNIDAWPIDQDYDAAFDSDAVQSLTFSGEKVDVSSIIENAVEEFQDEKEIFVFENAAEEIPDDDKTGQEALYAEASKYFDQIQNQFDVISFLKWGITNNVVSDMDQIHRIVEQCKDQTLRGENYSLDPNSGERVVEKTHFLIELASIYHPGSYKRTCEYEGDAEKRDELLALAKDNIRTVQNYIALMVAYGAQYESFHWGLKEKALEILLLAEKELTQKDFKQVQKDYDDRVGS